MSQSTECVTPWAQENSVQDETLQAQSAQVFFFSCYLQIHSSFSSFKKRETKKKKKKKHNPTE